MVPFRIVPAAGVVADCLEQVPLGGILNGRFRTCLFFFPVWDGSVVLWEAYELVFCFPFADLRTHRKPRTTSWG